LARAPAVQRVAVAKRPFRPYRGLRQLVRLPATRGLDRRRISPRPPPAPPRTTTACFSALPTRLIRHRGRKVLRGARYRPRRAPGEPAEQLPVLV